MGSFSGEVERLALTWSAVTTRARVALSLCLFLLLLMLSISCSLYRAVFSPEFKRDISGPLTVSSKWIEIVPDKPLKAEREQNAVMFDFAVPLNEKDVITGNDVARWRIRFPDGSTAIPEVQLVEQSGNTYSLSVSFFGTKGIGFGMIDPQTHLETLPRDKTYRAVRIKCEERITFSRVYWYSYNQSDRK